MPVFSSFDSNILMVEGDQSSDTLEISRTASGIIQVNNGEVQVVGGTPTVASTTSFQVFGKEGDDVILINEANGALPKAQIFGNSGNDTITGGAGDDLIFGGDDNDTLFGKGGADLLSGGNGDDVLTGGDGDDMLLGGAGNDRFVWNPGDDSDVFDGGYGVDVAEINGGNGDEVFNIWTGLDQVNIDRISPAAFRVEASDIERVEIRMNGGNDTFSVAPSVGLVELLVDGGAGNDTIFGE